MKKCLKYMYILLISFVIGTIPIKAETTGIRLNRNELTIGLGPEGSEIITYTLEEGLNSSKIDWKSFNESIVTVDSNGKVTGIREGTTTIRAYINGNTSTCTVTVSSDYVPIERIKLSQSTLNILIGTTEKLTPTITPSNATNQDIIWKSSDESIATIDENGKITTHKLGTVTIIAYINGYTSTCTVTVIDKIELEKITINKSELTIKEKSSETLKITYTPNNATNKKITWKSSDESIATVDENGKINAKKPGNVAIIAVSKDGGYVATCKVTVEALSKKVTSISLDKKELNIVTGEKSTLKVTINPSYAENKNVTWKSSDDKIATVENGEIIAISPGITEIKVTTEDGNKEAVCKVTVKSPPIKNISFNQTEQTVYVDSETTLLTISDPANSSIENPIWTSSDDKVATVENGVVKALSIGETIITVSNDDKTITASINIRVVNKPKEKLNITIEGYNLNFEPTIKDYTLEIGNEDKLKINTNISEEKVIINGNQNLKSGSIITITVAEDEKVTYVINIKKKGNYTIYFIAAISVLLLINLIRIMIKNKKK